VASAEMQRQSKKMAAATNVKSHFVLILVTVLLLLTAAEVEFFRKSAFSAPYLHRLVDVQL
jgi:hypothetical protein